MKGSGFVTFATMGPVLTCDTPPSFSVCSNVSTPGRSLKERELVLRSWNGLSIVTAVESGRNQLPAKARRSFSWSRSERVMQDRSILLVEDNDGEAILMCVALRKNGVTADVTRAQDGAEALDILLFADENGNALPSVVFLDLNLPKVSGLEVLKHIRSQDSVRMLPVVVVSSSAREEDVRNAYRLG